ncbi:MAG TPA: hypothetical protein DFR83_00225 [Deltaproteobacteria bacterium]|nr:hypothetical protein [Deltaproteobacteria bacterium]
MTTDAQRRSGSLPSSGPRLVGLDVARAVAIVGMVWVNFRVTIHGVGSAPAWAEALDGRAAALFVTLAGLGVSLMARGKPAAEVRKRLWARSALLWAFGMAWSPIWVGDILHYYGVWLAMAAVLITASSRILLGLAAVLPVVAVGLLLTLDYEAGWNLGALEYRDFWTFSGQLRHLFFNGLHPVVPWFSFLLIGMLLGRLELSKAHVQKRLAIGGFGLWAATEGVSDGLVWATNDVLGKESAPYLFGTMSMPPTLFYMVAGASLAVAVIGVCLWGTDRVGVNRAVQVLSHLGQLSLSVYIVHVGVALTGQALFPGAPILAGVLPAMVGFVLLALLSCHQWRLRNRRGPFEQLLRRVAG